MSTRRGSRRRHPLSLEHAVCALITRDDLEGARSIVRSSRTAPHDDDDLAAPTLAQLFHACATRIRSRLEAGYGESTDFPSSVALAERLSSALDRGSLVEVFEDILLDMLEAAARSRPGGRSVPRRARRFIDEHFSEGITTRSVAAAVACDEAYLCTAFKTEYGRTVGEYIRELRLERAKVLLLNTDLAIKTVAHEVGFGSYRTFLRWFNCHMGRRPSAFREGEATGPRQLSLPRHR